MKIKPGAEPVSIGKISKPWGNDGSIKVVFHAPPDPRPHQGSTFYLNILGKPVPFHIDSIEYFNNNKYAVMRVSEIDGQEDSLQYSGFDLLFPQKGKKEIASLEIRNVYSGWSLEDQLGKKIGIIADIKEIAGQLLIETTYRGKDLLIPLHPELIISVNKKNKILCLEIADGLLDIT